VAPCVGFTQGGAEGCCEVNKATWVAGWTGAEEESAVENPHGRTVPWSRQEKMRGRHGC
jgi:hypothetical protein